MPPDALEDNRLASYTEKSSRYQIMPGDYFHTSAKLDAHLHQHEPSEGGFPTRPQAAHRRYAKNRPDCRPHSTLFLPQSCNIPSGVAGVRSMTELASVQEIGNKESVNGMAAASLYPRRVYPLDARSLSEEQIAVAFAMTSRRPALLDLLGSWQFVLHLVIVPSVVQGRPAQRYQANPTEPGGPIPLTKSPGRLGRKPPPVFMSVG